MDVVLWQVRIVFVPIEGELQNPCARNLKLVAKILHILSDETEIFGDERQSAQLGFDPAEEPGPRTRLPRPRLGRGSPGRYVPGRRKPAEVVRSMGEAGKRFYDEQLSLKAGVTKFEALFANICGVTISASRRSCERSAC